MEPTFIDVLGAFLKSVSPDALVTIFVTLLLSLVGALFWFLRYYLKTHDIKGRYEDCKAERDKCRQVRAALEEDLRRLKAVSVFRHWLYLPGDPEPRAPICPQCWADGKVNRMFHGKGSYGDIHCYECTEHRIRIEVTSSERKELLERLGDKF